PLTRGRSSAVSTAATRPVKSSHWRTSRSRTRATLTSGAGIASAPSETLELQAVASAAASSSGSRRATRRPGEGNRRSMFIVDTSWWRGGCDGVEQRPRRAHVACEQHVAGGGAMRADAVERCGGGGRAGNDCGSHFAGVVVDRRRTLVARFVEHRQRATPKCQRRGRIGGDRRVHRQQLHALALAPCFLV